MNLVDEIKQYINYIKQNRYVYELQIMGMELFLECTTKEAKNISYCQSLDQTLDYFFAFWVPRRKKYLTEEETYNIVYTMNDFQRYVIDKYNIDQDIPIILDKYGEEYTRLYKARKVMCQVAGDPVISTRPYIIDLENYKTYKEKVLRREIMCMYEQGVFMIEEINYEGYVSLKKLNGNKVCKVLFNPSQLKYFKVNDVIHVGIKRKVFFIYWELEEVKAYYPCQVQNYL